MDDKSSSRVLLVDDDRDSRDSLGALLQSWGFAVDPAPEGTRALVLARDHDYTAILVDISLPGISGYDLAGPLRSTAIGAPMLIAVTGYAEPADRRKAQEAGFDHFLAKPIDLEQLRGLLKAGEASG